MSAKPGWKCKYCRHMQTHHLENVLLPDVFLCENGRVGVFERFITKSTRRGTSFSAEELHLMGAIFSGVMHGKDLRITIRNPLFPKLADKIAVMRAKSDTAAKSIEG